MLLEKNVIKNYCNNEIKNQWIAAPDSYPDFLSKVLIEKKLENENYILSMKESLQKQIATYPSRKTNRLSLKNTSRSEQNKWQFETTTMFHNILKKENIIGIHNSMEEGSLELLESELKDFMIHARKFAPELNIEELGQAIRNYIVYVMFAQIHQVKTDFNMAAFGYSMLYPFTDNYIDSPNYTSKEKQEYNQLIRDKILGKKVSPKSSHQKKTCRLLSHIEDMYPRNLDSSVFTLLDIMLEAQEESLFQQKSDLFLSYEKRLDISIYKGGVSVLLDRFFVDKPITREDYLFYLAFGFFLQLADDLQDISEDTTSRNQTLFTLGETPEDKEKTVNKLLHFLSSIMKTYHTANDTFKDFIFENCCQLIFSSVTGSKAFFTETYVKQMEENLPVSLSFMEDLKKTPFDAGDIKNQKKYLKILDVMIK